MIYLCIRDSLIVAEKAIKIVIITTGKIAVSIRHLLDGCVGFPRSSFSIHAHHSHVSVSIVYYP